MTTSIIQAELNWIASSPEEINEMALNYVPVGTGNRSQGIPLGVSYTLVLEST